MAPTIRRGASANSVTQIRRGNTVISRIYQGNTLVWSGAPIRDCFDFDGWLQHWIDELCDDPGQLIPDLFGALTDGLDNTIGTVVQYTEDAVNQTGMLVGNTANSAVDVYCGMWGGSAPNGLIGLLNGLPLVANGPLAPLIKMLEDWFGGTLDVQSIVGKIPVVGQLAQTIGLIPDSLGRLADPLNFVIDSTGQVIGTITCGRYSDLGGVLEPLCFLIGASGGAARLVIPDGLMNLDLQTSRVRHDTVLPFDDGYLEVEIAEAGSSGVVSQAFRRYSNNGTGAAGVGMDFRDSMVSIVRRVGSADTLVLPNAARFTGGDKVRLVQAGDVHSLFLNGEPVGSWPDNTATALKGAANRSVAMLMQGAQQFGGSRLLSTAFSCVEAA